MKKKLRIGIIGNGTIAVECTRYLVEQGEEIAFIVGDYKDDGTEGWQKSLKAFAIENEIPFYQPAAVNNKMWYGFFGLEAPDYLLSFQYRFIIKKPIIESAKKLAANLHFAPLPRYRGMYPIAWALMNGEKEFGVTLHVIDPGIDSGDIIAQKFFAVEEADTAKSLYGKAVSNGIELFKKSWPSLKAMSFARTPQDEKKALYYPMGSLDFSKTRIDWTQGSEKVFNFIRAYIFTPFQLPTFKYVDAENLEKELKVVSVRVARHPKAERMGGARQGEVLEVGEQGVTVACGSGSVLVSLTDQVSEDVPSQVEFAEKNGVKKGSVFV